MKKNQNKDMKNLTKYTLFVCGGLLLGMFAALLFSGQDTDQTGQFIIRNQVAVQRDTTVQRSPTSCTPGKSCANAFANGGAVATANSVSVIGNWTGYGFSIKNNSAIRSVVVRLDAYGNSKAARMDLRVSDNAGSSWGRVHPIALGLGESTYNIDVTRDFSWSGTRLGPNYLKTQALCYSSDGSRVTCNLDWIPVTVVYRAA